MFVQIRKVGRKRRLKGLRGKSEDLFWMGGGESFREKVGLCIDDVIAVSSWFYLKFDDYFEIFTTF